MSITRTSHHGYTTREKVGADSEHARQGARREEDADSARDARLGSKAIKEQQQISGEDLRRRLWALQRTMWEVTKLPRLRGCHRWIAEGAGGAALRYQGFGRASWGNLQTSSSVWASPLSAASISKARADEVTTALKTWFEQDKQHSVEFLTLTLAHNRDQKLAEVWDTLSYAWRGVTATASWRGGKRCAGDAKTFGVEHWLKTVEVTHGANGWHCHLHVLLFLNRELTENERGALESSIYKRWSRAAQRKGFKAPSKQHGVKLEKALRKKDARDLGAYMVKGALSSVAESLAWEITAGQTAKTGRKKENRTPFQILDDIRKTGDKSDVLLWHIWERDSSGRRQQAWSKGAKQALGIAGLSDEEAEAIGSDEPAEDTEAVEVAFVPFEEWGRKRSTGGTLRDDLNLRGDIAEYVAQAKTPVQAHERAREAMKLYGVRTSHPVKPIPIERVEPIVTPPNKEQAREVLRSG